MPLVQKPRVESYDVDAYHLEYSDGNSHKIYRLYYLVPIPSSSGTCRWISQWGRWPLAVGGGQHRLNIDGFASKTMLMQKRDEKIRKGYRQIMVGNYTITVANPSSLMYECDSAFRGISHDVDLDVSAIRDSLLQIVEKAGKVR